MNGRINQKSQNPTGKMAKGKRVIKTIVNRTIPVNCDCVERDLVRFEDDEIEMGHLSAITCNHCKCHKKKKSRLFVKDKTQKNYSLLAVIPYSIKVA